MSKVTNKYAKYSLAIIIIGTITVVAILSSSIWLFVQNKNARNTNIVGEPNNSQSDGQYNPDQPEEDKNTDNSQPDGQDKRGQTGEELNLISLNFDERVEGNLRIHTNYSRGIQFAYNKAWKIDKQQSFDGKSSGQLSFSNLPAGDSLGFEALKLLGLPGGTEDLKKE